MMFELIALVACLIYVASDLLGWYSISEPFIRACLAVLLISQIVQTLTIKMHSRTLESHGRINALQYAAIAFIRQHVGMKEDDDGER